MNSDSFLEPEHIVIGESRVCFPFKQELLSIYRVPGFALSAEAAVNQIVVSAVTEPAVNCMFLQTSY